MAREVVTEYLGRLPRIISPEGTQALQQELRGRVVKEGKFTPSGKFLTAQVVSRQDSNYLSFWCLGLVEAMEQKRVDLEKHRIRLTSDGLLEVYEYGKFPAPTIDKITPYGLREVDNHYTSDNARVFGGGIVLVPDDYCYMSADGEHWDYVPTDETYKEIQKGQESKFYGKNSRSFLRVTDERLVGKSVKLIYFDSSPRDRWRADAVVIHGGKLVDRELVFPWMDQDMYQDSLNSSK